ncbi:hypothetical protein ABPG74_007068 [Tetrahymena malaccensis]
MQVQRINERSQSQTRQTVPNSDFRQVLKISQQQNIYDHNINQQASQLLKLQAKKKQITHKPKVAVVDLRNTLWPAKEKENALITETEYAQNKVYSTQYLKTEGSQPTQDFQVLPFQQRSNNFKANLVHKQIDLSVNNNNRSISRESQRCVLNPPQISLNTQASRKNSLLQTNQVTSNSISNKFQVSQPKLVQLIAPKAKLNLNIALSNQKQTNSQNQMNINNFSINSSLNNSFNLNNSYSMSSGFLPQKQVLLGTYSELSSPSNKVLQNPQQQQPNINQLTTLHLNQNYYHQPKYFQKQIQNKQNTPKLKEIIPIARQNSHVRDSSQGSANINNSQYSCKTFTSYQNISENACNQNKQYSQSIINKSSEQPSIYSSLFDNQTKMLNERNSNTISLIQTKDSFYQGHYQGQVISQGQPNILISTDNQSNVQHKNFFLNQQLINSTEIRVNNIQIKEPLEMPISERDSTHKSFTQLCNSQNGNEILLNQLNQDNFCKTQQSHPKENQNQDQYIELVISNQEYPETEKESKQNKNELKIIKKSISNTNQVEFNLKPNTFSFAGDSFSNQIQEAEKSLHQKFVLSTQNLFLTKEDLTKMITVELGYKQISIQQVSDNPQKWQIKYQNSCTYEGMIDQNTQERQGFGKFIFSNGYQYDGYWENNSLNGVGTITSASGRVIYEGQFLNNYIEGKGIYYKLLYDAATKINYKNLCSQSKYVTRYEGQFKNNQQEGFGMIYFSSGERFVGFFENDAANGPGSFYTETEKIAGEWREGIFIRYKQ